MSAQVAVLAQRLEVDGVALEVARWPGGGDPILLLHEGLGSVRMWRDFPARLAATSGREVIAWSRRGYGASDPLEGARAPDYMHREGDAVPLLLDRLGVDRAILFGHSDGGSIALIAAARFATRISGLILEAPHVFVEDVTVASIEQARDLYQSSNLSERLGRYHDDADAVFWQWNDIWLDPLFRDWSIEDLLPAISAPMLMIQGSDDEYGTLDQLECIASAIPSARRLILFNCAHSPHRDQEQAVLDAVSSFVKAER